MNFKRKILTITFVTLLSTIINAQTTSLFCTHNSSTLGGFAYSNCDLLTDSVYDYTLFPVLISSNYVSSTVDSANHIYYFSDGVRIYGVNTLNNNLVLNLPYPVTGTFLIANIQYNPCDSLIYGTAFDYMTNYAASIISFNPNDSTLSTLAPLPSYQIHKGSGTIDTANNLYLFELSNSPFNTICGFDITLGAISFLTQISYMTTEENFFGISYDCTNSRLVGISVTASDSLAYLSYVTPLSGELFHINTIGWEGAYTPFLHAGSCIDNTNNVYYFAPKQNIINSVNLNTGNLISSDTISVNALFGIELLTSCTCPLTTKIITKSDISKITIYPNPASNEINITHSFFNKANNCELIISNAVGKIQKQLKINSSSTNINISDLLPGIYFIKTLINNNETDHSSFIIIR